jgi:hypothetical protein
MRNPTSPRLTVDATEDLLDGRGAPTPLRGLLAAAAAPGRAGELAGEATARAAFVAAGTTSAPPVAAWVAPSRPIAAKLLVVKVLAFTALAAGATGGVALAANSSLAHPFVTTHPSTGAPQSVVGARRAAETSPETPPAASATPSAGPSTPTLTSTPTAPPSDVHSRGTVARPDGPAPPVTHAAAKARTHTSPCATGSTADGCGADTGEPRPPTEGTTTSGTVVGTPAPAPVAAPVAAAPLADAPTATPTAESATRGENHNLDRVDSSEGNPAPEPHGGGHS